MNEPVALRAGIVAGLAMVVVSAVPGLPSAATVGLGIVFWGAIAVTFLRIGVPARALATFAPLFPLYLTTFSVRRDVLLRPDWVLNTDTSLHLEMARTWAANPRHPGFPVVTFPGVALESLLGAREWSALIPRESLVLQCALAGVLTAATLAEFLSRSGVPRSLSTAMGYVFALSLTPWTFGSVGDTYAVSAALGSAFLLVAVHGEPGHSSRLLGAILAVALGISLENAYLVAVWGVAVALVGGASPWEWTRRGARILVPGCALAGLLVAAQAQRYGPAYWHTWGDHKFREPASDFVEHLVHFRAAYTKSGGLLPEPGALAGVAYRFAVPAIRAQSYMRPDEYGIRNRPSAARWPGNVVFIGSLAVALAGAAVLTRARWRSSPARRGAIVLLSVFVARVLCVAAFVPRQSVLFSAPAVLAVWGVVGIGLGAWSAGRSALARRAILCFVLAFLAILVASNARYLLYVQDVDRWDPPAPPVSTRASGTPADAR